MPRESTKKELSVVQQNVRKLIDNTGMKVNAWARANVHHGIVQSTVNRIYSGKMDPSSSVTERIAFAGGFEGWQLLVPGFDPKRPPALKPTTAQAVAGTPPDGPPRDFSEEVRLSDPEREHVQWVRRLPKEDRDKLFDEIRAVGEKWKRHADEVLAQFQGKEPSTNGTPSDPSKTKRKGPKS